MTNENYSNYTGGYQNYVMLELGRRASGDTTNTGFTTNRIGLLATSITITTNKQSLALSIPFSGVISGESQTLAIDAGMASKTITVQGMILDQTISKQNKHGGKINAVNMTSHEVAQLLHSYVDSSFLHEDQNLSKLIILMPSRVDTNFKYRVDARDTVGSDGNTISYHETADPTELPLIPFTWANRDYDIPQTASGFKLSFGATPFPKEVLKEDEDNNVPTEIPGVTGFINDFNCEFAGQEGNTVTFNLTFTSAATAISDFINSAF